VHSLIARLLASPKIRGPLVQSANRATTSGASRTKGDKPPKGKPVVVLINVAGVSNFMHEAAHQWLDNLVHDTRRQNAPGQLRADLKVFLDWVGVKTANDIGIQEHEHWACGFEQYLMEGKAPTRALKSEFESFRTQLLSVYGSPTKLGKPITEEIRGVFNRMFATDEEEN